MKTIAALLTLTSLALAATTPALANESPGLVKIESVYADEATQQPVPRISTGVVVHHAGRAFILAKTHASQGSLSFKLDGKVVQPLGRLVAAGTADTEIIEVSPADFPTAFLTYDAKQKRLNVNPATYQRWKQAKQVHRIQGEIENPSDYFIPLTSWMDTAPFNVARRSLSPFDQGNKIFFQVPEEDPHFYGGMDITVWGYGTDLAVAVKFQPKMSGAPLIQEEAGKPSFTGTISSQFRNRVASRVTRSEVITETLQAYLRDERGNPARIETRVRHGLDYLVFPDGTREINVEAQSLGGPDTAGTGGPDTAGTGGPDTAGTGGARTATIRHGLEIGDPYQEFRLAAGFVYQGQPAVALRGVLPDGKEMIAAGNLDGVGELRYWKATRIEALPPGYPMTSLIQKRFGLENAYFKLEYSPQERNSPRRREVTYDQGFVQVDLLGIGTRRANLSFRLDPSGKVVGSNYPGFVPIVRVTDPQSGDLFAVDISQLFMSDPDVTSNLLTIEPRNSKSGHGLRQLKVIKVVNLKTGHEFRIAVAPRAEDEAVQATARLAAQVQSTQPEVVKCK